jgi:hypothetical protein
MKREKTLIYRKAEFADLLPSQSLQSLLVATLASLPKAKQRLRSSDDFDRLCINRKVVNVASLFFQIVHYEKGKVQEALLEGDDEEFKTLVIPAAKVDKKDADFLDSTAYVLVIGNHLVISQGKSVRFKEIESYLCWLLFEVAKQPGKAVALTTPIPADSQKKMVENKIRSIAIGADVELNKTSPSSNIYQLNQSLGASFMAALSDQLAKSIQLPRALEHNVLSCMLTIKFKKAGAGGEKDLLNAVLNATRNLPDDDVSLVSEDGTVKKGLLRLSHKVKAEYDDKSKALNELGFQQEMQKWLQSLLNAEQVS